jgi:serine/threonine-protein phosphatase 4 regulatory subunit 1
MTASELLNLLAECLGPDLCRQFVIPEVVSLAEDPVFRVRKSTALNFHNICKVGGEHELFERLMPAFVRLSKDDMYRVRRACAESLADISKFVSDEIRVGVLVEIFLRLTQDPSKLVKQSILQQSGMFIATLPPKSVNDLILGHFCSMASNPMGDLGVDGDLKHFCAYSFPGVLQTVGNGRWRELRGVSVMEEVESFCLWSRPAQLMLMWRATLLCFTALIIIGVSVASTVSKYQC